MNTYRVTEMDSMGYGNPEAKISYRRSVENGEFPAAVLEKAAEIIRDGSCVVPITDDDDGCIDGRLALTLVFPQGIEGEDFNEVEVTDPLKHKRAKVAGGGYITALAMKLALDPHVTTVDEDLQGVAYHLTHLEVYCGTHTGEHQSEDGVDCGANDNLPAILAAGDTKKENISTSIRSILERFKLGVSYDDEVAAQANAGLKQTLGHPDYFQNSNGQSRFNIIMENIAEAQRNIGNDRPLSVSKHLKGGHNEMFIVLNTVEGKTFSQAEFLWQLKETFPDIPDEELPMAFAIDVPRIVTLARAMATGRKNPDEAFETALYAGLAFQFATAATLTDGSLPMFVVK